MIGVTREHCLPAWQTLHITKVIAENRLPVWKTLPITGVTAENCFYVWQTIQMSGLTAEYCLCSWQVLQMTGITAENRLREYDTVARADNYFAEYRMLFLRRQSNERDIFRGNCIDVIKSLLRKNMKAPASSRIIIHAVFKRRRNTPLKKMFRALERVG